MPAGGHLLFVSRTDEKVHLIEVIHTFAMYITCAVSTTFRNKNMLRPNNNDKPTQVTAKSNTTLPDIHIAAGWFGISSSVSKPVVAEIDK